MNNKPFSISARIKSFSYAFQGFSIIKTQHNFYIHIVAALIAIFLSFYFSLSNTEWLFIIFAIGFVFTCELFNTAIEVLCDTLKPEINPGIKKVKDVSASAVLVSALTALIIGILIFFPKILLLF